MAPVVLDTDVASLIIKGRLPATQATKLIGRQGAITFVTFGELTKWSVMRNWGAPRRAALDRWMAARRSVQPRTMSRARGARSRAMPRSVAVRDRSTTLGSQPAASL